MKKQILSITLLFVLIASFTVISATAETYLKTDKEGLRMFLRQPSSVEGKINAEQLGLQLADTLTWNDSEAWVKKVEGISWNSDSPKRIDGIGNGITEGEGWYNKGLAGILDARKWPQLTVLNCAVNKITEIIVTGNPSLNYLLCYMNSLTSIDVSKNYYLTYFYCDYNDITSLDLSKNEGLYDFSCSYCPIIELDMSKNKELSVLRCDGAQLTSINLSNNKALREFIGSFNKFKSLDFSKNPNISTVICYNNQMLFSGLPFKVEIINVYAYSPQDTIQGGERYWAHGIDLESEYNIAENITVFEWFDITNGEETPLPELTTENGMFLLDASYIGKTLRCRMENLTFPKLSGDQALVYEINITDKISVTGISVDPSELSMQPGEKAILTATIYPENASIKEVMWESNNENVAIVDQNGEVTAISDGVATITATMVDGGFSDNCIVKVENVSVEDIEYDVVKISPNPTSGYIQILYKEQNVKDVQIIDLSGRVIMTTNRTTLDISHLPSGIYMIRILTDLGKTTHKIVKE